MEHLFIYPVLLFVTYLLYKVLKMKAGRNRLRKGGALPPMQTDMRKSVRDTTYMETVFPAEFKEHPDDADFFPDFAKMDIPENLGETLIEALSNSGIPETDAIGTSVEGTTGLQTGLVLKQFKQEEDMENKDLLKGMENASAYREMFLTRKMTGARRQTYIDESLYETLTGILPVIAPGISVPTFVNNVLAEHMEKYRDIIDGKYSINSLVYWVTYVHNVVYSFYRSMIYCYINSTQRCAGSIVIDIIPTNGADKRKFFPFAPYFPVTNVIKRYFYPYFPAIIGIKGYSFPYFPYLSGIMKIKTALYSLFSRLDWHKTVVFPCLGEIYEGIRSLSWEIPVT